MTDLDQQMLGSHDADIKNLKGIIAGMADDMHAMREAMDEMRNWKNEMRGGMKVAVWAGGVVGSVFGSGLTLLISHFWSGK